MRPSVRVLGVVLLGLLLVGMGSHYDANYDDHWPYPAGTDLDTNYETHVGEQTLQWGTVQTVDRANETVEIVVETEHGELPLTVRGVSRDVQPGGTLQVYGTVRPDGHLTADTVVVVNPAGSSRAFKYAVSLVGALLVVVLFFRHWRVDRDDIGFEVN